MILKCLLIVCYFAIIFAQMDSNDDYVDSVIDMLLNGDNVDFSVTQNEENDEGEQPVLAEGIWKCGECSNINESKLVYSEDNEVDSDMMNDDSVDVQIGLTLDDMRCITVSSAVPGVVRRVSGSCNGTTVTLNVAMVPHFTIKVYKTIISTLTRKMVVMKNEPKYSSIANFYAGKSVFITGGTGFLGRILIEKLLYSCPGINKIFVLAREKKGIKADQRVASIINNPLFTRLNEERSEDLKKLVIISGDITQTNLGISPENEALLLETVSIVYHSAATVKFNEPLKDALKTNVEGTEKVLNLCKRMKKIEILVHVSTAYANCNINNIEEMIYPAPADLNIVYNHLKQNEGSIETTELLMTPILKGPVEGWIDNWYGATGLCVAFAKGLNRAICGHPDNILDMIPADYVSNSCIVAAARHSRSNAISIYNCCSSSSNPVTLQEFIGTFVKQAIEQKCYIVPFPRLYIITKYKILVTLIATVFQIIPAYVLDFIRRLRGKSPRYVNLQSKITLIREALEFFSSHSWIIKNGQVRKLHSSLSNTDKLIFPMDPNDINWKTYLARYFNGVIVEKLLYSCSEIDKIYLLVREKNNDNINRRIENMLDTTLFNRLIEEKPAALKKIIPIGGDLTAANLGVSTSDQELLKENVSIVIHSGATVRFIDHLQTTMNINFGGTQKMLELSKKMKKLEAFVYVSTAFLHPAKKVLEEIVYPAPAEVDETYKFIKNYGHIEKETKRFLMTPIKDGPVTGWLENWRGITGLLDNMAKGWNRVTLGKGHYVPDIVPVDYVSNLIIVAAAKFDRSKIVPVYNSCSSSTNPISWEEIYALFIEEGKKRGYNHIPYPFTLYSNSEAVVKWLTNLLQYIPAYIADLGLKMIGKKPKYVNLQSKITLIREALEFFSSHSWIIKNGQVRKLHSSLSNTDKLIFPMDPNDINWKTYLARYFNGVRKYLEKIE
ncbi:hypothetical protein K1T71_008989 [Dendrolimus kikuchii]|uniref:Uncharacterized protein n=1 Tax=Dendrolimus kikuchii TaxID=765133 RepID=A0ACC1CVZ9_9NEOP|nr:hypothetical protein K1T71_008989 [Dendrolimus kikuchii]